LKPVRIERDALSTEVITDLAGLDEGILEGWRRLVMDSQDATPFAHPSFSLLWKRFHDPEYDPFILIRRSGRSVVAVAPMEQLRSSNKMGFKRYKFIVSRSWMEMDLLPSGSMVPLCMLRDEVRSSLSPAVVDLFPLSPTSETIQAVQSLELSRGEKVEYSFSDRWSGARLVVDGNWGRYRSTRSAKMRKNIRRNVKRLESMGKREVERIRRFRDRERVLGELSRVVSFSWKESLTFKPGDFWAELITELDRLGWLDLFVMRIDSSPVSFALFLHDEKRACLLQTGYDERYSQFSPGTVLLWDAIESLFADEDQTRYLDFLTSYRYLRRFATCLVPRVKVRMYLGGASSFWPRILFWGDRQLKGTEEVLFSGADELFRYLERHGFVDGLRPL